MQKYYSDTLIEIKITGLKVPLAFIFVDRRDFLPLEKSGILTDLSKVQLKLNRM